MFLTGLPANGRTLGQAFRTSPPCQPRKTKTTMKNSPNKSASVTTILGVTGIVAGFALLCAVGAMAQSADQPVSLVSVAASSEGLPQVVPPPELPRRFVGTYWWVLPGGYAAPVPCLPQDFNGPVFQICSNEFILDQSGGDVNPRRFGLPANLTDATVVAAANDEVQSLEGLITWIQVASQQPSAPATTMSLSAKPMGGGGFGPMDQQSGVPYLSIAPTNGMFLLTVYNDQGPANYAIWWTPVLSGPECVWQAIAAGTTGVTNFLAPVPQFSTGFYRAEWDTNSVPSWIAADPNNPAAGPLAVFIDSPANGAVIQ